MHKWYKYVWLIGLMGIGETIYGMEEKSLCSTKEINSNARHRLKIQLKDLRQSAVDNDVNYGVLSQEMCQLFGSVKIAFSDIFADKRKRVFEKIQKAWNILLEDINYLEDVCKNHLQVYEKKVSYNIHAKSSWLYNFEKELQDPSNVLNACLIWCPTTEITIKIIPSIDCMRMKVSNSNNPAQSISFGPIAVSPVVYLSEDFFKYARELQTFTIVHEIAHMILHHYCMNFYLARYCAECTIVKKANKYERFDF